MLKIVTEGDARKVVLSSGEEQGFKAWKALHGHFEPGIAVREGQVVAEFSSLIMKPAKSVQETKNLILEMEERRRRVERVTGKAPDEMHAKSVLAGILDPETRKQVALLQGAKHTYEEMKTKVLEFTNVMIGTVPEPMNIGRVTGLEKEEW